MPEHNNKHNREQARLSALTAKPSPEAHKPEPQIPETDPDHNAFFWEIPGDVPGKHARPDFFSSPREFTRTGTTPAATTPRTDTVNLPTTSALDSNTDADTHSQQRITTNKAYPQPVSREQTDVEAKAKPFRLRPALLVLLLVVVLGGAGYNGFFSGNDNLIASNTIQPAVAEVVSDQYVETAVFQTEQRVPLDEPVAANMTTVKLTQTPVNEPVFITHVVKKGDTLWDLAEKYVKDPFRYPELAELSKIVNPHLIYPGDIVRIQI